MSRRLEVVIPIAGTVCVEFEVPDDFDETDLDAVFDAALDVVEDDEGARGAVEWEYYRHIVEGNVLCVHTNEVDVISDTAAG